MALSKLIVASLLVSLVLLNLVDAHQSCKNKREGSLFQRIELVELVVNVATASHPVLRKPRNVSSLC
ncbi:hypothetical protein ACSQ67_000056 [Phaseolus vulgaris]